MANALLGTVGIDTMLLPSPPLLLQVACHFWPSLMWLVQTLLRQMSISVPTKQLLMLMRSHSFDFDTATRDTNQMQLDRPVTH
jgi:hypothetical protein